MGGIRGDVTDTLVSNNDLIILISIIMKNLL